MQRIIARSYIVCAALLLLTGAPVMAQFGLSSTNKYTDEQHNAAKQGDVQFSNCAYSQAEHSYMEALSMANAVTQIIYDKKTDFKPLPINNVDDALSSYEAIKKPTVDKPHPERVSSSYLIVSEAAQLLHRIGICEDLQNRFDQGDRLNRACFEQVKFALRSNSPIAPIFYSKLEGTYQQILSQIQKHKKFGPDSPAAATMEEFLGSLYFNNGKPQQASPLFKHAVSIRSKSSTKEDLLTQASDLRSIHFCYISKRLKADQNYAALEAPLLEKVYGPNKYKVAGLWRAAGQFEDERGNYRSATDYLQRAITCYKGIKDDEKYRDRELIAALSRLSSACRKSGETAAAQKYKDQADALRGPSRSQTSKK